MAAGHRTTLALIRESFGVEHKEPSRWVGVARLANRNRDSVTRHDFVKVGVANIQAVRMRLIQFSRQLALGFRHSFESLERTPPEPLQTRPSRRVESEPRARHPRLFDQMCQG